ncbi:hypothetical protein [Pseudohaliea sp.]|uniref:hypothetical protein n=1 Tax=Pseudohaliea sp. TaxID=2740289 RepID=UPI0032EED89F
MGDLVRYGTILKDAGTGKIVAHVQETGLAGKALSTLGGGPFGPVSSISSIVANVQLVKIQGMLAFMQALQFATLGAAVAGIGVSAAGFASLNKKVAAVGESIQDFRAAVEIEFERLAKARIRDMLASLHGHLSVAEQNFLSGAGNDEWQRVGRQFIEASEPFRLELEHELDQNVLDATLLHTLIGAWCLSNNSATRAFLLADDLRGAEVHARTVSEKYDSAFDELSPVRLAQLLNEPHHSERQSASSIIDSQNKAQEMVDFVREVQETAAAAPFLIETLHARRLSGREYVLAAENEERAPLVLLPNA